MSEPLAEAFGAPPVIRGLQLSPDGTKISFLQGRAEGGELVRVFDTPSQTAITPLTAGAMDGRDITSCKWVNETRLLCEMPIVAPFNSRLVSWQRLVAVGIDGSAPLLLLSRGDSIAATRFQDQVIDWLPDDRENVLVAMTLTPPVALNSQEILKGFYSRFLSGAPILRLNVYGDGRKAYSTERALGWLTDGHGTARLAASISHGRRTWSVLNDGGSSPFHETDLAAHADAFTPVSFDRDTNEVLYLDRRDGRAALFAADARHERAERLVYAHPDVDIDGVLRIGKYGRVAAAAYVEDRPRLHFLDATIERAREMVSADFAGMTVDVVDEDWGERYYLMFVYGDRDPGTYYLFDSKDQVLRRFGAAYPALGERGLAVTKAVSYAASDGRELKSYLTLPPGDRAQAAVVVPRGGPEARGYWELDFLAQYLAARGYAVLGTNYRSFPTSFADWRQASSDASAGAKYLVDSGTVAPDRICLVGWGRGAYVALLSAIEHREQFRCVAGIASATDAVAATARLAEPDDEARHAGALVDRAQEIGLPTLLLHGDEDVDMPFKRVERLAEAMRDASRDVALIRYARAGNDIAAGPARIDMLTGVAVFLGAHLSHDASRFYSPPARDAVPVDVVDFGSDSLEMDGQCSDRRFRHADGRLLSDPAFAGGRPKTIRQDASDCRRLYLNGEIVLLEDFELDRTGHAPAASRAAIFVDPSEQDDVAIVGFDAESIGPKNAGVAVVYTHPGFHTVSVLSSGASYTCTVALRRDGDPFTASAEDTYRILRIGSDTGALSSEAMVPAYAGHYYRIETEVANGVLLLRVIDAGDGRAVSDHHELVSSVCAEQE